MIAIIGGSGLDSFSELEILERTTPMTEWGEPSAPLATGLLNGVKAIFLARHGYQHQLPPHQINYRANIAALKSSGATQILAVNAVGGIDPLLTAGELVVPDQLIDYTWGRAHTFFDGQMDYGVEHIDFTYPFTPSLRERILASAKQIKLSVQAGGTCAVTQGPRLETIAEIQKMANDGCHIVGMTNMPEAALAKEAGLEYACIALVVNPAAGISDQLITLDQIKEVIESRMPAVRRLLLNIVSA